MTPSTSGSRQPAAIVGLDAEKSHKAPTFAIACTIESQISRFSLLEDKLGKEEATWTAPKNKNPGGCWSVSIHPDSEKQLFATSGVGSEILILSSAVETFGQEKMKIAGRGEFSTCLYSPDGRTLAVASNNGQLALHDAETGDLVQIITGMSSCAHFIGLLLSVKHNSSTYWQYPKPRLFSGFVSDHHWRRRQADQCV